MAFAVAERSGSFVPAYERDAKGWPEAMVELLGVEFHRGIEEEWDRGPRWSREVLAVEDSKRRAECVTTRPLDPPIV
jgi:hypothetical protein